jgi:hypothetical protein
VTTLDEDFGHDDYVVPEDDFGGNDPVVRPSGAAEPSSGAQPSWPFQFGLAMPWSVNAFAPPSDWQAQDATVATPSAPTVRSALSHQLGPPMPWKANPFTTPPGWPVQDSTRAASSAPAPDSGSDHFGLAMPWGLNVSPSAWPPRAPTLAAPPAGLASQSWLPEQGLAMPWGVNGFASPANEPAQRDASAEAPMSFFGAAAAAASHGVREGWRDIRAAFQPWPDSQPEQDDSPIARLLQKPLAEAYNDPNWWAAQIAHVPASSWPSLAVGLLGGWAGGTVGGPLGGLGGSAIGFGLGALGQELVPAYHRARAQGLSHDEAVNRAWLESGIAGALSAGMGFAFGAVGNSVAASAKEAIGNALKKVVVVPIANTVQRGVTDVIEGKPLALDELGQKALFDVLTGGIILAGHKAISMTPRMQWRSSTRQEAGPTAPSPATQEEPISEAGPKPESTGPRGPEEDFGQDDPVVSPHAEDPGGPPPNQDSTPARSDEKGRETGPSLFEASPAQPPANQDPSTGRQLQLPLAGGMATNPYRSGAQRRGTRPDAARQRTRRQALRAAQTDLPLDGGGLRIVEGEFPPLPRFKPLGPTTGFFQAPGYNTMLRSGFDGPAASLPKGIPGIDIKLMTHVEVHAAAIMRQEGIREAVLYINNPDICRGCTKYVAGVLPRSSVLYVVLPSGRVVPFRGRGS